MNRVILIGRLTKDPDLRFTAGSGKAICNFNLAVNEGYGDKQRTDFFRVVVWNKSGENCANYLKKGSLVAIDGRIQNNNYEKDGVKHYGNDIVANRVQFLDTKGNQGSQGDYDHEDFSAIDDTDDDIPF